MTREFTWELFERILATRPRPDPKIERRRKRNREAAKRYRLKHGSHLKQLTYEEYVAQKKAQETVEEKGTE